MLVVLSDLHSNPYGEFSRGIDSDGSTVLGNRILKTVEWAKELCQQNNAILLNNGDFTDTPGVLNSGTIDLLGRIESVWATVPRIYNLGNHDQSNLEVGHNNLLIHKNIPGIIIPDKKSVLKFDVGDEKIGTIYVVPFVRDVEFQKSLLDTIPDKSIVAVHCPIIGIRMTPSVSEESGIDASYFKRFKLTFAGHYHLPQIYHPEGFEVVMKEKSFVPLDGTIIVSGTPLPQSFSDTNPSYGVWTYDGTTCTFLKNPESVRYVNLHVESVEELEARFPKHENCIVSVSYPKPIHDSIKKVLESKTNVVNSRLVAVRTKDDETSKESRIKISEREDILNSIREFLDQTSDFSHLDKKKIIETISPLVENGAVELGGNIEFVSLGLKNFMSWGESEIDLSGSGLRLIYGLNEDTETAHSNGSGKTSLMEALIWVLYDTTLRPVISKDDVIRKNSKHGCNVSVRFVVDGVEYEVSRFRKTTNGSGASISRKNESGTWEDISSGSLISINNQILDIIGIPFNIFTSISFFGSHFSGKFSDLGDTDKKAFLGKILGLSRYEKLREKVSHELVKSSNDKVSSLERTVASTNSSIDRLESVLKDEIESANKKEAERVKQLSKLESDIKSLETSIPQLTAEKIKIQEEIGELNSLLSNDGNSISILKSRLLVLKEKKDSINSNILSLNKRAGRLNKLLESKQNEIESVPSECPACGQSLKQEQVNKVRESLAIQAKELLNESDSIEKEITEELLKKDLIVSEFDDISAQLAAKELPLSSSLLNLQILTSKLSAIEIDLNAKTGNLSTSKQLRESLSNKDLQEGVRSLVVAVKNERKVVDSLITELDSARKESEFNSQIFELLGPKALISFVLDNGINQLNYVLRTISEKIFGNDYSVSLSSSRELKKGGEENKITIIYTAPSGSYGGASDGEKRKADISIHLALNVLAGTNGRGSTNIIVADEILDSLDSLASGFVLNALSDFANSESKRIFIISHSDSVKPFVSDVLTVVRKSGISRVVDGDL